MCHKTKKPNLKADIITIKGIIDLMSLAERVHFLQDVFQMTAIVLVLVIDHYHIKGLLLLFALYYRSVHSIFDLFLMQFLFCSRLLSFFFPNYFSYKFCRFFFFLFFFFFFFFFFDYLELISLSHASFHSSSDAIGW